MVGFTYDNYDLTGQDMPGLGDQFGASMGEVAGASLRSGFEANPTVRILREQQRFNEEGRPEVVANHWDNYRDPRNQSTEMEDIARERGEAPRPQMMDPADIAKEFPLVKADAPMARSTAQSLQAHKQAEVDREHTISRNQSLVTGMAGRFGLEVLAGLIDPLNIASAFVPIVPEGMALMAATRAAGSLGTRVAARAGVGAIEGAAGQALMEPLNYALDRSELNDWTMASALRNIAFGAVMGGGLHVGLGGIVGRVDRLDPADRETIFKAALSQVVNEEPVNVKALLDFAEARKAYTDLERWHRAQEERMGPGTEPPVFPDATARANQLAEAEARLTTLRSEADRLRAEHGEATQRLKGETLDPESQARLEEVRDELRGVISKARRRDLQAEEQMLLEGVRPTRPDGLEAERTQAQAEGLAAALTRAEGRAAEADVALGKLRAVDDAATAEEAGQRRTADREARIEQDRTDSRERLIQSMMEKELRRFAHATGAALSPAEVRQLARDIRLSSAAERQQAIDLALQTVAKRGTNEPILAAADVIRPPTDGLKATAKAAADEVAAGARTKPISAELRAEQVKAEAIAATAPKVEGDYAKQLAEMTKDVQKLEQELKAEIAAGRSPDRGFELAAADKLEQDAKGLQEAVACLVRRGI